MVMVVRTNLKVTTMVVVANSTVAVATEQVMVVADNTGGGCRICQIYGCIGHSVMRCYDHFHHCMKPEDPRMANYSNSHNNYQDNQVDTNWHSDTNAAVQPINQLYLGM
jgi:hypothetical protein